jgi:archaellum component FlaF (FlaF/FlaG flagellin family)
MKTLLPFRDRQVSLNRFLTVRLFVNPITGELVLNTTESGYIISEKLDSYLQYDGTLINTKTLNDYWFPSPQYLPIIQFLL